MDLRENARLTNNEMRKCLKKKQQQQTDKRKTNQKQKPKKSKYKIILPYSRLGKMIVFDSSSKSKVNASSSWASDFGYWWSPLSRDERVIYTRRASLAGNSKSGTTENCYPRVGVFPVILARIMHFGHSLTFIEKVATLFLLLWRYFIIIIRSLFFQQTGPNRSFSSNRLGFGGNMGSLWGFEKPRRKDAQTES